MSFAHDFKVPKKSDIEKALGPFDEHSSSVFNKNFYETFDDLPLPKKPSDWLAENIEKGQTYMEFTQLSRTLNTPLSAHRKTIYLTTFGQIDSTIFDINNLIDYIHRFFQMQVKLIQPFVQVQWNDDKNQWICTMKLTDGKTREFKLRTRYDENSKRSQICVTAILNLLKKVVPDDARCLVALTMAHDFYGNDEDLFIAGLSMGNCRVAAFSLYRYDPYLIFNESDWFDYKFEEDQSLERQHLLLIRTCRLLTHEICHLLGIDHCIFYSCLMNGSGNLDEDFSQPLFECPIDLRKLYSLIQFDIRQRYEELMEFYRVHHFIEELKLVEKKLDVIKQSTPSTKLVKRKCSLDKMKSKSSPKHLKSD